MRCARQLVFLVLVACAPTLRAQSSSPTFPANAPTPAVDLTPERELVNDSNTALASSDPASARGMAAEAVNMLLARPESEHNAAWLALLNSAGRSAYNAQDSRTANVAWRRVFEIRSRTLPDDSEDLQTVRSNLASTLYELADFAAARSHYEKFLEVAARTLPDDDLYFQRVRSALAQTSYALGDRAGARALFEKVLEVCSRTLPDEHPDLMDARTNLAVVLSDDGDFAGARVLQEKVLAVCSRTLPDDDPELQLARNNLASTLADLGDLSGARVLKEKVLEVRSRTLPSDHPSIQETRLSLAATITKLGDLPGALALQGEVLEQFARAAPNDVGALQVARSCYAATLAMQCARAGQTPESAPGKRTKDEETARAKCAELVGAMCALDVRTAREAILTSMGREAEERCSSLTVALDTSLSYARGMGVFEPMHTLEPESFLLAESTRGAAIVAAELARKAASSPKYAQLRTALQDASYELAGLGQNGTTSAEFDRTRTKRESAEREIVALAHELSGGRPSGVEFDVERLAARLDEREAAAGYRRFKKWRVGVVDELDSTGQRAVRRVSTDSLCAFVVRRRAPGTSLDSAATVTLVDLGPIEPIAAAVRAWREAIGVGSLRGLAADDSGVEAAKQRGDELRTLVFDPLIGALGDADHIVVALDDVLHLAPLEALPFGDSKGLVGDRWRIETRSTLTELLTDSPDPTGTALIALGGVSFNAAPIALSADDIASMEEEKPTQIAAYLRGSNWERGFAPLTYTADEARGIGALYREVYQEARPVLVLEKRKASREALEALAPRARYVHIATHGWFAPESIQSWNDPEPLDQKTGFGARRSGAEQVKRMSPMLLCGLALTGANLSGTEAGRMPGLVTADELSTLDLSGCELVVLSACDTNVGERRAGQGVASFQKALQMAGARSVITSLWKVPDEATKDLMIDFYRRLWAEKKPKWQALWEAKKRLREAKDESGASKYATRDWAAWVLTGAPN